MKRITLKDIAKLSDTSISTVSRVLNGDDTKAARPEIKEKIWKIANKYNYRPNRFAQSLKKAPVQNKKCYSFGIIFARLDETSKNPFFTKLSHIIEKEIRERGYQVGFTCLSDAVRMTDAKDFFTEHPVDGVIILGKFSDWLYQKIRNHVKNYIYVGLNKLIFRDLDQVIVDGHSAAINAVNYLYGLGHRNIMYVGETAGEERYSGYVEAMNHLLGDRFDQSNIIQCHFSIASSYKAVKQKYIPKFTALFCGDDLAGIGTLQALQDMKYQIPRDVSVISIDNIELIQNYTPLLTTVNIPIDEMGKMAIRMILERINDVRQVSTIVEFPYEIIRRETTEKYFGEGGGEATNPNCLNSCNEVF